MGKDRQKYKVTSAGRLVNVSPDVPRGSWEDAFGAGRCLYVAEKQELVFYPVKVYGPAYSPVDEEMSEELRCEFEETQQRWNERFEKAPEFPFPLKGCRLG